jgi:hypothetical protein
MTDVAPVPFTMVGDPDAATCEGDACLVPRLAETTDRPPQDKQ